MGRLIREEKEQLFKELVFTAFGDSEIEGISEIFLKKQNWSKTILDIKLTETLTRGLWYYFKKNKIEEREDEKRRRETSEQ